MKSILRKQKGISLITLTIAVLILVVVTNMLIYKAGDSVEIKKLNNLYSDIDNLRDKVISYESQNGSLPAKKPISYDKLTNLQEVFNNEELSNKNFYIIDLSLLQGVTLNYGEGYKMIQQEIAEHPETAESVYTGNETDLYIINKTTYNIFNIQGIAVKQENGTKTYYTDYTEPENIDIDLRYVEGVLVPDGYYYIGKNSSGAVVISATKTNTINSNDATQYAWHNQEDRISYLTDINLDGGSNGNVLKNFEGNNLSGSTEEQDFIKSVNRYKGFFINSENKVLYKNVESQEMWSQQYTKTAEYTDSNGDKATIPTGFRVSMSPFENTVENGLVVLDENDNEYVWIPCSSEEYENSSEISEWAENNGKASGIRDSSGNRKNWADTQATEVGLASLKKMEERGNAPGFYVARYEAGIPETATSIYASQDGDIYQGTNYTANAEIGREDDPAGGANQLRNVETSVPISKKGVQAWNCISQTNSDLASKRMVSGNDDISSYLIDSHAWDTVCEKMIEKKDKNTIIWNSKSIGNYSDSTEYLNTKVLYAFHTYNTQWIPARVYNNGIPTSKGQQHIELATGISEKFKVYNIYDMAGNMWEWTTEKEAIEGNSKKYTIRRGGGFSNSGITFPIITRFSNYDSFLDLTLGFRAVLYFK